MSNKYIELLKNRRSIYGIGKDVTLADDAIVSLVKEAVKESPASFNSQTSRVVVLFNESHNKLWSIVEDALRKEVPADAFEPTLAKLNSFRSGYGTILFFEDTDIVKNLQNQFELYADNFPVWSEQSSGIAQHSVWTALAEENIGASLQHYNPLIDVEIRNAFNIPENWELRAQMPFGSIEAVAGDKDFMSDDDRFLVIK